MKMPTWIYDDLGIRPSVMIGGIAGLLLMITAILLYADAHAHDGEHCVQMAREYQPPTYIVPKDGGIAMPIGGGMQDVCVRWEKDR